MYGLCANDRRFQCDMILMVFFYQIQQTKCNCGQVLVIIFWANISLPINLRRIESKHFPKWVGLGP